MAHFCPAHDTPQFDCDDCRRIASIRQAAADGRIELASTVLVDTLEPYVELVLNALNHSEALVTNLSTIGDFGLDDDERLAANATLGVTLSDDDYIYEVAQRLRDKGQRQTAIVSILRQCVKARLDPHERVDLLRGGGDRRAAKETDPTLGRQFFD